MSAIIKLKTITFPNCPAYILLCIIYKTLYINFPKYLLESLSRPEITSIKLRSSIDNFVLQAHLSHSCHQSRSFIFSAPIIWNKLPFHIRSTSNHNSFKNLLKSYLLNNTSFLYKLPNLPNLLKNYDVFIFFLLLLLLFYFIFFICIYFFSSRIIRISLLL